MHWTDNSINSFMGIYVISAFFIILTLFASTLRIDNVAKDALFAMYA